MKKWFSIIGTLVLITFILCVCLTVAVVLSWPAISGLLLFFSVVIASGVIYGTYYSLPRIIKHVELWFLRKIHGRNRLERLLWRHWWRGARLQGMGIYRLLKRRSRIPPWLLVLGMHGGGQRGLLADSQLTSLAGGYVGSSHERLFTCRWWFFRRVMYMVLSGHFISGRALYHQAWLRLVRWIGWVRSPDGVVLCVQMSLLQESNSKARLQAARQIREQLEPLQHQLGFRLPIWVVVTHSEVLPGFKAWSRHLSDGQRRDILGEFVSPQLDGNCTGASEQILKNVVQALKASSLRQLNHQRRQPDAEILILPDEVARLQPGLREYLNALFECDHYQQHSLLRGLFFTASETREGAETVGLFSQKLLEEVLPQQKREKVVLASPRVWRRRVAGVMLAVVVLSGISSSLFSMHKKVQQLKCVASDTVQTCNYARYRQVEAWRTIETTLFYPVQYILRQRLAASYLQGVADDYFQPESAIPLLPGRYNDQEAIKRQRIVALARFINNETAMRNGSHLAQLQQMPAWSANVLTGKQAGLSPGQDVAIRLAQYRTGKAKQMLTQWRDVLQTLLENDDWSWLLDDSIVAGSKAITLKDFWPVNGGTLNASPVQVNAVYTRGGEQSINVLLDEIEKALARPEFFAARRATFMADYQQKRQAAWMFLAQAMSQGENQVRGKRDWQRLMTQVGHSNSPYMAFFRQLATDTADIPAHEKQSWLSDQDRLWQLHSYIQKSHVMQRVSMGNFSLRQRILSKLGLSPQLSVRLDDNALISYRNWRQMLQQTVQRVLLSDKDAEQLIKSALGEEHDNGSDSLYMLLNQFDQWRTKAQSSQANQQASLLWHLWQGDDRLLIHYAFYSTADKLQKQWDGGVIWPADNNSRLALLNAQEQTARLFDYGNRFIRETAGYALNIHPEGIARKEVEGITFPFNDAFLSFINDLVRPEAVLPATADVRRRLQEKRTLLNESLVNDAESMEETPQAEWINLTLTSQPTTANRGARLLPVGSTLTLNCNGEVQRLDSINFYDSVTFRWSPHMCQQIQLDIQFPDFRLSRVYRGPEGMISLIRAFSSGELVLSSKAFPQQCSKLAALDINTITVRYQLEGASGALAFYRQWRQRQQQQKALQQQRQLLDKQLLNLNAPQVPKGTLSALPLKITSFWNTLGTNK